MKDPKLLALRSRVELAADEEFEKLRPEVDGEYHSLMAPTLGKRAPL